MVVALSVFLKIGLCVRFRAPQLSNQKLCSALAKENVHLCRTISMYVPWRGLRTSNPKLLGEWHSCFLLPYDFFVYPSNPKFVGE